MARRAAIRSEGGVVRRERLHLVCAVTEGAVLVRIAFDRMRDGLSRSGGRCCAAIGCCRWVARCAAIGGEAGMIRRGRLHLVRAVTRRAVLVRFAVDRMRNRLGAACRGCPTGLRRGAGFRCGAVCGWFVASCAAIDGETGVIRRGRLHLVRAVARGAILVCVAVDRVRDRLRTAGAGSGSSACRAVSPSGLVANLARFFRTALVVGRHRASCRPQRDR